MKEVAEKICKLLEHPIFIAEIVSTGRDKMLKITFCNDEFRNNYSELFKELTKNPISALFESYPLSIEKVIKSGQLCQEELCLKSEKFGRLKILSFIFKSEKKLYGIFIIPNNGLLLYPSIAQLKAINKTFLLLLTIIRHDVKNSLFFIKNSLEIITKTKDFSLLERINFKINNLITELDEFKNIQQILTNNKLRKLDLNEIIVDVLNNYPIDYTIEFSKKKVFCDECVRTIISNIISNSIKHNKGKVYIHITVEETNHYTAFTFYDTGRGSKIDRMVFSFELEEEIEKIFFQKSSNLGFYIMAELMKRYGGFFVAKNSPLGGYMITLFFLNENASFSIFRDHQDLLERLPLNLLSDIYQSQASF